MKTDTKQILAASGGAFVGGIAIKKVPSALTPVLTLAGGVYLAMKGKNQTQKAAGLGLASVGAIGTAGKIAEKIEKLQPLVPTLNGTGELYEDEYGNLIELDGLDGEPQLVQDEHGNTYMVNGVDEPGLEEYVSGLGGDDLTKLV